MSELSRPRLTRAWSNSLITSRSLGSLGEYDKVRSRPTNTMEERAAKQDNDRRKRENGRSLRFEHTAIAGRDERGKPPPSFKPDGSDEVLLRWASEPMQRAVDAAFADSKLHSKVRAGVPPNLIFDHGPAPGDCVLQPVAVFEVHDPYTSAQYAFERAKMLRSAQKARSHSGDDDPPVETRTDGLFDDAVEALGTGPADNPKVAAGPVHADGPLNERILFHAAPAGDVLEILYGGLFELAEASPERGHKVFGPGHYFSDLVCTAHKYAGDPRDARQKGSPGTVLTGHMRLTPAEASSVRFMLVYRTLLGPCPARTSRRVPDPPDVPPLYHEYPNEGAVPGNIFDKKSEGKRWGAPFTSLVAQKDGCPSEFVIKHASRCLPVALVAYKHVPARNEQLAGRLDRWW